MAKKYTPDNPLMRFVDSISGMIFLSIFWVIGYIPVLTAGASTAALYYAAIRAIRGEGSPKKNFFKSYRENLKQAVLAELVLLALAALLYGIMRAAASMDGGPAAILHVLAAALLLFCVIVTGYIFPLLARFDQSTPALFRNAFLISLSNFPYTVAVTILNLIPLAVYTIWPTGFMQWLLVMLFMAPGLIAQLNSRMLVRVFAKYEPQSAEDSTENTDD